MAKMAILHPKNGHFEVQTAILRSLMTLTGSRDWHGGPLYHWTTVPLYDSTGPLDHCTTVRLYDWTTVHQYNVHFWVWARPPAWPKPAQTLFRVSKG